MSDAGVTRIKRPQSLTALVAEQIRDMIVTERFALGELLSENIIAALLGVSRAPVRDAFVRLETEGLVKVQPQRGTFVFQYDATELREICELRQVLETGALRIATACHRAGVIEALRRPIEAAEREGELDPKAYQPFDTAFHDGLVRSSGNNELMDAYGRISGRVRAIRHRLTRLSAHVVESQRMHRAILQAIEDQRDDAAEAALVEHVYAGYRRLLATRGGQEPATDAVSAGSR
ncbi:MAG TPA: GntR family transcriptional regulator [Acetobacteraceae bacterium]